MRILFLDDDRDLRATMCDMVSILGKGKHECLSMGSFHELLERAALALETQLAILDINLGAGLPDGLDAEAWLREQGYKGRIVFLTGHGRGHPLVQQAAQRNRTEVLEKPQGLERLFDLFSEDGVTA